MPNLPLPATLNKKNWTSKDILRINSTTHANCLLFQRESVNNSRREINDLYKLTNGYFILFFNTYSMFFSLKYTHKKTRGAMCKTIQRMVILRMETKQEKTKQHYTHM